MLRRMLWTVAAFLLVGAVLYYVTRQVAGIPTSGWFQSYQSLMQVQGFWQRHGIWLHPLVHGISYLYLIWRWPDIIGWVNCRREAREFPPMSQAEQRSMAVHVIGVIAVFEVLLLLRHLD